MKTILSFWNRFIVGLICFMMVNVNITVDNQIIEMNMSSVVYASDSEPGTSNTTNSTNSGVQQGEDGKVKIKDDKGGGLSFLTGDTMSFIVFMAASIIIGRMLYKCKKSSWDIYVAAAAALIYIAGELMTMFGSKEELKSKEVEYSTHGDDGKIDDSQYQALVKEKEALEAVAKAADKKAGFQKAASVAFGAAAVTAIGLQINENMNLASCTTAIAGAATVPTCAATKVPVLTREATKQLVAPHIGKKGKLTSVDALLEGNIGTCVAEGAAESAVTMGASVVQASAVATACNGYIAANLISEPVCTPPGTWDAAWGATSGFMAIFTPILWPTDVAIDYIITTSWHRAGMWGALGLYGAMVAKATSDQAKKARDNIKEIDKLLNKMDMSRMESNMASSNIQKVNLAGALNRNLASPVELSEAMPCASGNGKVNQTTGQVECPPIPPRQTNKATKTMSARGYEGITNLASELVSGIQGNKEITPSVQASIDKIGAMKSAIEKKTRNDIKKLNKLRKALGKSPYDHNKNMNNTFGRLTKAVKSSLLKNGLTPDGLLARAKLAPPSDLSSDDKDKTNTDTSDKTIATTGGKAIQPKKNDFKFDFNVDDEVAKKEAEFAKNEQAAAEAGDENEDKGDIIEDKSVSIFKVISIRYMKSGFNRLLDEL